MHLDANILLRVVRHKVLRGLRIVVLGECSSKGTHLIRDLLHWIIGCRGESRGRIISQFLVLRIVSRFLKLHLEIVQETVVSWTLRRRATKCQTTGSDVVLDQFTVVRWLTRQLDRTVFEDVLEHGSLIWTSYF